MVDIRHVPSLVAQAQVSPARPTALKGKTCGNYGALPAAKPGMWYVTHMNSRKSVDGHSVLSTRRTGWPEPWPSSPIGVALMIDSRSRDQGDAVDHPGLPGSYRSSQG